MSIFLLTVPTVKIVLLLNRPEGRREDSAFDGFSKYLYIGPSTMTLGYGLPRVRKYVWWRKLDVKSDVLVCENMFVFDAKD